MFQIGTAYVAMLVFFICAELIVLTNFMNPLFVKYIGHLMRDQTNFYVAALFYFFYVAGVYWFATKAGLRSDSISVAILSGAFLGLLAFGTYEITNFVILKDWKAVLVIADISWGIIISGSLAGLGYMVVKWLA